MPMNQTLSRTLLTAGTTTITVAIMYFFGGPGIHGFTFVLLIGILVGTYSSVAIAGSYSFDREQGSGNSRGWTATGHEVVATDGGLKEPKIAYQRG